MKKGAVVSLRAGARNIFDSSKPLLARFRRGDSASHVRVELITVNKRLSVVQYLHAVVSCHFRNFDD